MIVDQNDNPIDSKSQSEEPDPTKGDTNLQAGRLREGQLRLIFADTASKRLGAIGRIRMLEQQKVDSKMVSNPPELIFMYKEAEKLEIMMMQLVAQVNFRTSDRDEARASALGIELYSDEEFFGRAFNITPVPPTEEAS